MILEHEKSAHQKLAFLKSIASEIDPDLSIQVGIQPPGSSVLNYKVFEKQVRLLPDFALFDGSLSNSNESVSVIRLEFSPYLAEICSGHDQKS